MSLPFATVQSVRSRAKTFLDDMGQEMYDMDEVIQLCLVALYADGHVLLEGNPGMGKTDLVKSLARRLGLPDGRIQFTPDLMPADITGTRMPDFEQGYAGQLLFRRGPIFTSLLLADEINRATPKTQSALLEAMAERQVTVLGEKYRLDMDAQGRPNLPFMVLATQNPIDHEGVYELPEAQLDRFLFKIEMPLPRGSTLQDIMRKRSQIDFKRANGQGQSPQHNHDGGLGGDNAVRSYLTLRNYIKEIEATPTLMIHIVNIVLASNGQMEEESIRALPRKQREDLELLRGFFRFGLGPRSAIGLVLAAKAWSLLWGENTTSAADGGNLAHVLIPTLRHRLHLKFDWEDGYAKYKQSKLDSDSDWVGHFLIDFALATAPDEKGYRKIMESQIAKIAKAR